MLGKMFRTTFFPFSDESVTSERSPFTNLKSGALEPTAGRVPTVETGEPWNAVFAILGVLKDGMWVVPYFDSAALTWLPKSVEGRALLELGRAGPAGPVTSATLRAFIRGSA
jgi:hypothetical protein